MERQSYAARKTIGTRIASAGNFVRIDNRGQAGLRQHRSQQGCRTG